MMRPKQQLLPTETVLDDADQVFPGNYYLADLRVVRCRWETFVLRFKQILNAQEIRRCDRTKHWPSLWIGEVLEKP